MNNDNYSSLINCRCCDGNSLFKLFNNLNSNQSLTLCLDCFHIQKEQINNFNRKENKIDLDKAWLSRYLYAKYGNNRIGLNLLNTFLNKSILKNSDDSILNFYNCEYESIENDYLKNHSNADFIIADNIIENSINPKKILDKFHDMLENDNGVLMLVINSSINNTVSVFSGYSLSTLAARSKFGIVDIFKIKKQESEITIACLKKFEPHSNSLDKYLQDEHAEGRYDIGAYYEENFKDLCE